MEPNHFYNFSSSSSLSSLSSAASSSPSPFHRAYPPNFMQAPPSVFPSPLQHPSVEMEGGTMNPCQDLTELRRQHMRLFWHQQMLEISQISGFKQHGLPLARIKRIMKSDEAVKMISSDAPVLFAKACELFIMELTLRSWLLTEENKKRTLQRCDIAQAISRVNVLDFLLDLVPSDDLQEEEENGGGWDYIKKEEALHPLMFQSPLPSDHFIYDPSQ